MEKKVGAKQSRKGNSVGVGKSKKSKLKEMLLRDSEKTKNADVQIQGKTDDSKKESTNVNIVEVENKNVGEGAVGNDDEDLGAGAEVVGEKVPEESENVGLGSAEEGEKTEEDSVGESEGTSKEYQSKKLKNVGSKEVGVKLKKLRKDEEFEDKDYAASVDIEYVESSHDSDEDFQNVDKEELRKLRVKRKSAKKIPSRRSKRLKKDDSGKNAQRSNIPSRRSRSLTKDDSNKIVLASKKRSDKMVDWTASTDISSGSTVAFKATPRWLATLVKDLFDMQKEWVKKSGFGKLLKFNITGLPLRLGAQVISALDINEMKLKISSGEIDISKKVVAEILGIPRGKNKVKTLRKNCDRIDRWRSQFGGKAGHKITIKSVSEKALVCAEVDEMFKLNFLVVMMNSLVQCLGNPYVNQRVINFEGDLDDTDNYNWCELLMKSLIESVPVWQNDKRKIFAGPLLFLVVLYVDRMVCKGKRLVKRVTPAFIGWTEQLLHEREIIEMKDNNFGRGSIVNAMNKSRELEELENVQESAESHGDSREESLNVNLQEDVLKGVERAAKQYIHWKTMYEAKWNAAQAVIPGNVRLDEIKNMINRLVGGNVAASTTAREGKESNVNSKSVTAAGNEEKMSQSVDRTEMAAKALDLLGNDDAELESPANDVEAAMESPVNDVDTAMESIGKKDDTAKESPANNVDIDDTAGVKVDDEKRTEECKDLTVEESGVDIAKNVDVASQHSFDLLTPSQKVDLKDSKGNLQRGVVVPSQPSFELLTPTQKVVRKDCENVDSPVDNTVQSTESIERLKQSEKQTIDEEDDIDVMAIAGEYTTQLPKLGVEDDLDKQIDDILDSDFSDENETKKEQTAKRKPKIGEYDKSPYVDRVVELSSKRTYDENTVWEWVNNAEKNPMDIVFRWDGYRIVAIEMETMQPGAHVSYNIVDIWAKILNKKEDLRATGKPLRFFIQPTCVHGTLHPSEGTAEKRWDIFKGNMDIQMKFLKYKLSNVGMVIFAVCTGSHWYLVSFNLKNPSCEVIDNSAAVVDFTQRYEGRPLSLVSHFSRYLKILRHPKADEIGRLVPQRIKMPWRTKENHEDCGIFAMRHMECYMGRVAKNFNTGFVKESGKQLGQLNRLRSLYSYDILGSSWNELKDVMIFTAASCFNRQREKQKEMERIARGVEKKERKKTDAKKRKDTPPTVAEKIVKKKK